MSARTRLGRRSLPRRGRPGRRGAASLVVLLLLLMASLLVAAWSSRNLHTSQRVAASEWRRIAAFDAAEAGLAWGQAMLNSQHPVGETCLSSAGGATFITRHLGPPDARGRFAPRPAAPRLLCARSPSGGWTCHCPEAGEPSLPLADDGASTPSFLLQFDAGSVPGTVQLLSIGCDELARPCLPGSSAAAGASTRLRVGLALLPALVSAPAAALTSLGSIDAGSAALGLHNADAQSGGLAAHSGGPIRGSALRVQTVPGGLPAAAVLGADADLAATPPEALFQRHVGSSLGDWLQQPGVLQLDCAADCGAALQAALAAHAGLARIHLRGPSRLVGPLRLGSPTQPVQLVVDGALSLHGAVQVHGLLHAHTLRWDGLGAGEGGRVHGAVLLTGDYLGNGAPDIVYDAALMQRLRLQHGHWLRIPGSWRDF